MRTDWTPLAQQFQQQLYQRIFKRQSYQDYVRDYVGKTLNGDFDDQLVYRKRLRRKLDDYQRNVPPHARAARIADDYNRSQAAAAVSERRLDQLRDDRRRAGTAGNAPFAHRLSALPRTPAATGGRRYTPFLARRFHHAGHRADGAVLRLRQVKKNHPVLQVTNAPPSITIAPFPKLNHA
ncbi:hypothetical protein M8494_24035 [Serratia ureilytica]